MVVMWPENPGVGSSILPLPTMPSSPAAKRPPGRWVSPESLPMQRPAHPGYSGLIVHHVCEA